MRLYSWCEQKWTTFVGNFVVHSTRTVLCKSNANEMQRISFFVLANFRAKFRVKFRKISCEKFHCQTIFRAKFQGNIARYFRRTNEQSLFRKFAEAKFRAATNKLIAEFILETENRLRRETRHKTENSSNVNPVCDEFPVSIYPSNFPGQTDEKVWRETRQRPKSVPNSY